MDTPDHMYSPQFFKAVWKSEVYRDQKANNSRKIARTKGNFNLSFFVIQYLQGRTILTTMKKSDSVSPQE
jgi:hypothetical protein